MGMQSRVAAWGVGGGSGGVGPSDHTLTVWPSNATQKILGVHQSEVKTYVPTKMCTETFIEAFSQSPQAAVKPGALPERDGYSTWRVSVPWNTGQQRKQPTGDLCSTLTLQCIFLRGRSQTQKATDAVIPFIGPSGKDGTREQVASGTEGEQGGLGGRGAELREAAGRGAAPDGTGMAGAWLAAWANPTEMRIAKSECHCASVKQK